MSGVTWDPSSGLGSSEKKGYTDLETNTTEQKMPFFDRRGLDLCSVMLMENSQTV